jgi:iron complex outermembrane receptor protein
VEADLERTSLSFDALYSNYDVTREENWLEGFSFARAISQNGKPQTAVRELVLRDAGTSHTAGVNLGQPVYDVDYARFSTASTSAPTPSTTSSRTSSSNTPWPARTS